MRWLPLARAVARLWERLLGRSQSSRRADAPTRSAPPKLELAAKGHWHPRGGTTLVLGCAEEGLEVLVVEVLRLAGVEGHVSLERITS